MRTLMVLHRIDCLASHGGLDGHRVAVARLEDMQPGTEKPPRLVSGRDLLALGVPPGPIYGQLLQAVEDAQLNGEIDTREAALALLSRLTSETSSSLPPDAARAPGDEGSND